MATSVCASGPPLPATRSLLELNNAGEVATVVDGELDIVVVQLSLLELARRAFVIAADVASPAAGETMKNEVVVPFLYCGSGPASALLTPRTSRSMSRKLSILGRYVADFE